MPEKRIRVPLKDEQRSELAALLKEVPTETVVKYGWSTDEGQAFVKAARKAQVAGVPLNWIADELGIAPVALSAAVGYWERPSGSRGSTKRLRETRARERRRLLRETERARASGEADGHDGG